MVASQKKIKICKDVISTKFWIHLLFKFKIIELYLKPQGFICRLLSLLYQFTQLWLNIADSSRTLMYTNPTPHDEIINIVCLHLLS